MKGESQRMKKATFAVKGMTCASCVAHVERAAGTVLPAGSYTVSLLSGTLSLTLDDGADEGAVFKKLQTALSRAGYGLSRGDAEETQKKEVEKSRTRLIVSAVLTALLMLIAMWHMIPFLPAVPFFTGETLPWLFFLLQFLLAGAVMVIERHFLVNGFSALFHGAPNMDSLVALGSTASALYGMFAGVMIFVGTATGNHHMVHTYLHDLYLESAATILTLVSVGKFLEGRARHKAAGAVRALIAEEATSARVRRGDLFVEIPLEDLQKGDVVQVPAGEKIPADGKVLSGTGSVNEAMLTGESLPRTVTAGDGVYGAALLTEGLIEVEIEKVGSETTLRRIAALLEETAATKAPAQRLADRVSAVFVPVVLGIAVLTAAVWLIAAKSPAAAFRTAVSVLVISCPCALGLATPTAIAVGSGRGARFGILFKSAEALETLAGVKTLLTDKTGTLTRGEMSVTDFTALSGDEETAKTLLASMEANSTHPVAVPLAALTDARAELTDFEVLPGKGLRAVSADGNSVFAGKQLFAGNRRLFETEPGAPKPDEKTVNAVKALENEGKSVVLLSCGSAFLALAAVADTLRPDSRAAVAELQKHGVQVVMLTGDHEGAAKKIAAAAGVDGYRAGLLPKDKEEIVAEYTKSGVTAMVGDGINDAPALARADVGLAIGAGTGVAVESAGVVLSGSSLTEAVAAVELGKATRRNIRENLFWALFYNAVCIPLAAGVFYPAAGILLTPMIASAAMSLSSLFVVLNALRLWRFVPPVLKEKEAARKAAEKAQKQKEKETMFGKKKEETTTVLHVKGMMCGHCVAHVEKALSALHGVKSVKVDLEAGTATVVSAGTDVQKMKEAITAAGYTVE